MLKASRFGVSGDSVSIFERKEFRWLCLGGLFFVYTFLAFKDVLLPYLTGDIAYAFNTDNFWSYSSGFIRRALLGQILYFNQSVLGIGPWFFSVATFALVVLFAGYVCVELSKTMPAWQVILLALTPFALLYFVDAEILMLLPLLAMVQKDSRHQKLLVLLLIIVLSQMRELVLVLYFPVLLRFIFIDRGVVGKASIAFIAVMSFLLLWDFGPPSYALEKTFWPEHGAPDLHEEHLYTCRIDPGTLCPRDDILGLAGSVAVLVSRPPHQLADLVRMVCGDLYGQLAAVDRPWTLCLFLLHVRGLVFERRAPALVQSRFV